MPKADRDWKAYFRAKDEDRKKVDRQTRKFRPLTDEVVRGHLVGDHTIGVYPLLQDETCWFLAVDFDKKTWQRDATAFLTVCCELNVPAALERSRSGNGGHVWIFFDQAIPATTARKLGCAILTRAMESRHHRGRKILLFDIQKVAANNLDVQRQGAGYWTLCSLSGWWQRPRILSLIFRRADSHSDKVSTSLGFQNDGLGS
jgi:hypothetical protein